MKGRLLVVALAMLSASFPVSAHHSFGAEYDGNKPVTLTGVVTNVQWTNPHFYFFVDVKNQKGEVANWKFEGYPPTVLNRIGWKRNETMRPGDTVTVFGWRARDGTNWAHSREVTFAKTGRKLQSGPPAGNGDGGSTPSRRRAMMTRQKPACFAVAVAAILASVSCQKPSTLTNATTTAVPRTADGKPDLSGVWQPGSDKVGTWEEANQGVGVPDPGRLPVRRGGPPPYQPWAAQKVRESWNVRGIDNAVARCIPQLDLGGGPLYPLQFVQTPQLIVILVESRHVFRLIPLNAKHPDDLDPSYLGDSVGHWEGDTLVVDVTGFKEQLAGADIHTDAWHVVERYTRLDYNTINYEATLEDPKALTKPWTIQSKIMLRPGTRLQEYVCEENNQDPAHFEHLMKEGLVRRK